MCSKLFASTGTAETRQQLTSCMIFLEPGTSFFSDSNITSKYFLWYLAGMITRVVFLLLCVSGSGLFVFFLCPSFLLRNNGRHLWRRLPPSAKAKGGETAALWGVGKCLSKREMGDAQAALRGREWSPSLAPYIALIENRVKERQLIIIPKAFTALPLARVSSMLACSIEDAEKECATEGWEVVAAGAEKTVKPKARVSAEAIPTITPDYLQKMANHIAFLERQNQG
ncbi:unnamed protein product [Pylaiella littoralis]